MDELTRLHNALTEHLELRAAWERERVRTDMMAMQRGAILDVVHRMQLGNHTVADLAARVEEILKAGMAAEVARGYDEQLARVTGQRDDALQMVDTLRTEVQRLNTLLDHAQDRPWQTISDSGSRS